MFLEFSQRKMMTISLIVAAIIVCIGSFLVANNALALLARSEEYVAMNQSNFWYWLLYELPGRGAAPADASVTQSGSAHSIPVLLYHGEGSTSNMPLAVFVDQLRSMKAAGWQTITVAQFEAFVERGTPVPDKSFLLTFDDGRKDTYYQADPVLKDLDYHAVMFVITGFSLPTNGKQPNFYLNATELGDMAASGRWELESHGNADHATYAVQSTTDLSHTASTVDGHFLSNKFWNSGANRFETDAEFTARVLSDQQSSKQTLEKDFSIHVNAFAYPFNDFGQDSVNFPGSEAILDMVVPSVYQFAFYQTWPGNGDTFNYPHINNGPGAKPYMVKRIEPLATWSGSDLLAQLDQGAAKQLPYASTTFGGEWVDTWGNAVPRGTALALSAKPTTSGASVFLNGTRWWTDYIVTAKVIWGGGDVSLVARNQDDAHYLSCTFDEGSVSIEWHAGATHAVLAAAKHALTPGSATFGMAVYGNAATCYAGGVAVVSVRSSLAAREGGIGVEIWNPALGSASATLQSVTARALSTPPSPVAATGALSQPASAAGAQAPATNAAPRIETDPLLVAPAPEGTPASTTPASTSEPAAAVATPTVATTSGKTILPFFGTFTPRVQRAMRRRE